MAGTPQELIIRTPINQYASYSTMFCPLHTNINKEQHEKHLCNPSSHHGNTENILVKCAPHILICESYNTSISAIFILFHNIVSKHSMRSASAIFMSRTETFMCLLQIVYFLSFHHLSVCYICQVIN